MTYLFGMRVGALVRNWLVGPGGAVLGSGIETAWLIKQVKVARIERLNPPASNLTLPVSSARLHGGVDDSFVGYFLPDSFFGDVVRGG